METQGATIISERPRRTRAQVLRDMVRIDLAMDADGQRIAVILAENGVVLPGCDWSRVFPHWLVAKIDDEIVGCLQIMPSKPVGYCEFLYVTTTLGFKMKALTLRKLMMQGISAIQLNGSTYCACTVDVNNKSHISVLDKLGTKVSENIIMATKVN